jgi:CotS family spore coat protein
MVGIHKVSTPHIQLKNEEIKRILSGFGLKFIDSVPTRKVFHIMTPFSEFALKPTRLTPRELSFIQSAVTHLKGCGLPVAALTPTVNGDLSISYRSHRYILMPWFPGREADFNRQRELLFGVKIMARIHRDGGGFFPKTFPEGRFLWGRWPGRFASRLCQLREFYSMGLGKKETFDRLYRRYLSDFYRQGEYALEYLSATDYLEISAAEEYRGYLCHHDLSDRNLLLNPENCCLLDFDYCLSDLRLHDLANLMLRILRHDDWQWERARWLLMVYHRQYPMTTEHLQILHAFLSWPQDFWQIGLQYYIERQPWPMSRFLKSLHRRIKDEPARQYFLTHFPANNGVYRFSAPGASRVVNSSFWLTPARFRTCTR